MVSGITKDGALYGKVRACSTKATYASEAEASIRMPGTQQPYLCGYCGQWHRATTQESKTLTSVREAAKDRQQAKKNRALRNTAEQFYPSLTLTGKVIKAMNTQINGPRRTAKFIRKISVSKSLIQAEHNGLQYYVVYSKTSKQIERFIPPPKVTAKASTDEKSLRRKA